MRLGISFTDVDGARRNLEAEVPKDDPAPIRAAAKAEWQAQLDTVQATGGTASQRRVFATAMYRAFQAPHVFEDVDGRYPDFRGKIRTLAAPRKHQYATFSGWDTFRCQMPLVALVDPERYTDMCAAMLEMGPQCGLPRWPLANNAAGTMSGQPLQNMLATGRAHAMRRRRVSGRSSSGDVSRRPTRGRSPSRLAPTSAKRGSVCSASRSSARSPCSATCVTCVRPE